MCGIACYPMSDLKYMCVCHCPVHVHQGCIRGEVCSTLEIFSACPQYIGKAIFPHLKKILNAALCTCVYVYMSCVCIYEYVCSGVSKMCVCVCMYECACGIWCIEDVCVLYVYACTSVHVYLGYVCVYVCMCVCMHV